MSEHAVSEPAFDWYRVVSSEEPLQQGDLLDGFPIPIFPASIAAAATDPAHEPPPSDVDVPSFNVVVMTQSCDFRDLKETDTVILCPRFDYLTYVDLFPKLGKQDGWGNLIRGRAIGAHLISQCELDSHQFDYQVINLQRVFSIPYSVVKAVARSQAERVRLLPPYREHLAQSFARQFMRIGLPIDLPRKCPY